MPFAEFRIIFFDSYRMLLLTETVVVKAPSIPVGCMLLLTVVVPVVLVPPTVCGGVVSSEVDAVERKHTTYSLLHRRCSH